MPRKKKNFEPQSYPMYQLNELDFGFIILCYDHNTKMVLNTAKSIRRKYSEEIPIVCIADKSTNKEEMAELKDICPSYKASNSWASLINTGMKKTKSKWSSFIIAGSTARGNLQYKFSTFMESDKDIMYPIADRQYQFENCTLNGLMINKEAFAEIGDWNADLPLQIAKLLWGAEAEKKGFKLKAVIGTRMI